MTLGQVIQKSRVVKVPKRIIRVHRVIGREGLPKPLSCASSSIGEAKAVFDTSNRTLSKFHLVPCQSARLVRKNEVNLSRKRKEKEKEKRKKKEREEKRKRFRIEGCRK